MGEDFDLNVNLQQFFWSIIVYDKHVVQSLMTIIDLIVISVHDFGLEFKGITNRLFLDRSDLP